jgi:hypothetical protein
MHHDDGSQGWYALVAYSSFFRFNICIGGQGWCALVAQTQLVTRIDVNIGEQGWGALVALSSCWFMYRIFVFVGCIVLYHCSMSTCT